MGLYIIVRSCLISNVKKGKKAYEFKRVFEIKIRLVRLLFLSFIDLNARKIQK